MFKWASCNIQLVRLQEKYIVPLYVHSWQCRRQRKLPSHSSVHFALQLHIYRQGSDTFQLLTCALCRSPLSRHCVSEIQIAANAHGLMPLVVQPTINSSPTCNDRNIKQHQGNNKRDPVHNNLVFLFCLFHNNNKMISICLCVADAAKHFETHKEILWQIFNNKNWK